MTGRSTSTQWIAIAAGLVVATPGAVAGQQLDRSAAGMRTRVEVCADTAGVRSGRHTGQLLWHDSATVALSRRDSADVIPLSHVREVEVNTRRSRELQGVGLLVGLAGGVASAFVIASVVDDEEGYSGLLSIPFTTVAGAALGYFIGGKVSGREEWQPLPLPARHAAACVRATSG